MLSSRRHESSDLLNSAVSFKMHVILVTGNEAGSKAVRVERP